MNALFSLFFLLGLLFIQINAQATPTGTASISVTATASASVSVTSSLTASPTLTVTPSASLTATSSQSGSSSLTASSSVSKSGSISASGSISGSPSQTPSTSSTMSAAPNPQGFHNGCPGHAVQICLAWNDPTGLLKSYFLYYRVTGSTGLYTIVPIIGNGYKVTGLNPSTSYDFYLIGINALGVSSTIGNVFAAFSTSAGNPKQIPSIDITNFVCAQTGNGTKFRKAIFCTWNAPKPPATLRVAQIHTKCVCTSVQRQPVFIRKILVPATTSYTYLVNRDVATCVLWVKATYRRIGTVGRLQYGNRQQTIVILN